MSMGWSFEIGDEDAKVPNPPEEVVRRISAASDEVQQAMERSRAAAARLAAAVRYASEQGVKASWIAREAGVTVEAVERVLAGGTLFGE